MGCCTCTNKNIISFIHMAKDIDSFQRVTVSLRVPLATKLVILYLAHSNPYSQTNILRDKGVNFENATLKVEYHKLYCIVLLRWRVRSVKWSWCGGTRWLEQSDFLLQTNINPSKRERVSECAGKSVEWRISCGRHACVCNLIQSVLCVRHDLEFFRDLYKDGHITA